LSGYFSRIIYGPLDKGMTVLQLPLEVFTQRNFVADFIQLKLTLKKNEKIARAIPCFALHAAR